MANPEKTKELKKLHGTYRKDRDKDIKPKKKVNGSKVIVGDICKDHSGIFENYIDGVLSGKIITGELIQLAVKRHLNDLKRVGHSDFPFIFDMKRAEEHLIFAETCRHWKGEKAKQRVVLEPHQVFQWMNLYGWYDPEKKTRRFHRAMKLVGRKNYKTTEAAIMAIDHLEINPLEGPQVYAGSMKHDQSIIVVNDAGKIIQRTPELDGKYQLFFFRGLVSRVVREDISGFMAPLSKENESSSQDGLDPSFGIIDEYHAHPDDRVVNILESGFGNRPDWFEFIISTAGANKYGPCYADARKTGINILKGIQEDDQAFFMYHELDEDDCKDKSEGWKDVNNWVKANPRMISDPQFIDYLNTRFTIAKNQGGEKETDFKTKNLNMWVDQYNSWVPDDLWMQGAKGGSPNDLIGRECYAGLDLAQMRDFNSLVLLFPNDDGSYCLLPFFWMPQSAIEGRTEMLKADLSRWVKEGYIIQQQGNAVDHEVIASDIRKLAEKYHIIELAIDPAMQMAIRKYIDEKLDGFLVVNSFNQDIRTMNYPSKQFTKLIVEGKINHYGNPVLRWMAANAATYTDSNDNFKFVKDKSIDKIDGIISSVMALGIKIAKDMVGTSKYDDPNYELIAF